MARVHSRDSVKVTVEDERKEDVKDVATALEKELRDQGVKLSIDVVGLLYDLLIGCGYEPTQETPKVEIGDSGKL